MKICLTLLAMSVAGSLAAQPLRPAPQSDDHSARTRNTPWQADFSLIAPAKPNEIVHGNHTYSGVAVQFVKTQNPLQLVNPCAPAEYGTGHENLDRDLITHKVTGFKIFSFSF
jgi:hypothetical protein